MVGWHVPVARNRTARLPGQVLVGTGTFPDDGGTVLFRDYASGVEGYPNVTGYASGLCVEGMKRSTVEDCCRANRTASPTVRLRSRNSWPPTGTHAAKCSRRDGRNVRGNGTAAGNARFPGSADFARRAHFTRGSIKNYVALCHISFL